MPESPDRPAIAVVTPSYNQASYIERAIRSVLDQGFPGLEYIVLDGGSTDGTVEIIRRYEDRLAYWRSHRDGGQAAAVNEGWRRASAPILGWLNSDDFFLPGSLDLVARYFQAHASQMMVYGPTVNVDASGRVIGHAGAPFDWRRMVLGRNMVPQPSVFLRREAFEQVGPLDEALTYALDFDYFLRVAKVQLPAFVDRPLSGTTIHADAKTTRDRAVARQEIYRVGRRHASPVERLVLYAMSVAGRIYHALPAPVRGWLDRRRGITTV